APHDPRDADRSPRDILQAEDDAHLLGKRRLVEMMQDNWGCGRHAIPRAVFSRRLSRERSAYNAPWVNPRQICRSTIFSLSSAIASEGFKPFGQALAQFMMV